MAHHSTSNDPEMNKMLANAIDDINENAGECEPGTPLGPTGMFPEGKLTEQDEGETAFEIGTVDGKVVLKFGAPTSWVGMSAEQAIGLAKILYRRGMSAITARPIIQA